VLLVDHIRVNRAGEEERLGEDVTLYWLEWEIPILSTRRRVGSGPPAEDVTFCRLEWEIPHPRRMVERPLTRLVGVTT
jgi:hypothetical protein